MQHSINVHLPDKLYFRFIYRLPQLHSYLAKDQIRKHAYSLVSLSAVVSELACQQAESHTRLIAVIVDGLLSKHQDVRLLPPCQLSQQLGNC